MPLSHAWIALLLALPSAAFAAGPSATHGAELFHSSGCEHCHGAGGIGGGLGPDLSGVGRALKPAEIERQIKLGGGAARESAGNMPAYGDILSPQDVSDLVAYLKTHRSRHRVPPIPPAKS